MDGIVDPCCFASFCRQLPRPGPHLLTNVEGNGPLWSELLAEAPQPEPSHLPCQGAVAWTWPAPLQSRSHSDRNPYAWGLSSKTIQEPETYATCRGSGWEQIKQVTTNTRLADLNIQNLSRADDRRIEVIANGLPMWGGSQLAVDTPPRQ